MAKITTRRSISLKGLTYQRLQKFCNEEGQTMSGYLEVLINSTLDAKGYPEETVLERKQVRTRSSSGPNLGDYKGSQFTF